ncbi:hypothetical protein AMTR_s00028p00242210, partial [Amborella trichopoda]
PSTMSFPAPSLSRASEDSQSCFQPRIATLYYVPQNDLEIMSYAPAESLDDPPQH